jgi:hypothetical protein
MAHPHHKHRPDGPDGRDPSRDGRESPPRLSPHHPSGEMMKGPIEIFRGTHRVDEDRRPRGDPQSARQRSRPVGVMAMDDLMLWTCVVGATPLALALIERAAEWSRRAARIGTIARWAAARERPASDGSAPWTHV